MPARRGLCLSQRLSGVRQIGLAVTGGQALKHQNVVLRGAVEVRWQLVVEQIGDAQVHQWVAVQQLHGGLDMGLFQLEFATSAGDPYKPLRRRMVRQGVGLMHRAGQDVEDAHGR